MGVHSYVDIFEDTTLGPEWSIDFSSANTTHNVSGGTFNSVHLADIEVSQADMTVLSRIPAGPFWGGHFGAKLTVPAAPLTGQEYGGLQMAIAAINYMQASVYIYTTVGLGYWKCKYAIDDSTQFAEITWDPTHPWVLISKIGTTTIFQHSSNGTDYSVFATLTSDPTLAGGFYTGTDSYRAPQTYPCAPTFRFGRLAPSGYLYSSMEHTFSIDDFVHLYYDATTVVIPRLASARWNLARYDLVGDFDHQVARYLG